MKWILGLLIIVPALVGAAEAPLSDASYECLDCHAIIQPGLVADWQKSRHAATTPQQAMAKAALSRRMLNEDPPEDSRGVAVGCAECHMLRPEAHADTFDHNGYAIHVVVSPSDCAQCHRSEAQQYQHNLMSHAYHNLAQNPVYMQLERSAAGDLIKRQPYPDFAAPNADTRAEACFHCHGTYLQVKGTKVRESDIAGALEFPIIEGWPNQGVGRINLDGTQGACTPCHTRHAFSVAMARKPYTCKQCHVGPDVPAYKVYSASKHGNIFESMGAGWRFDQVPWTIGQDFTAPTCAACHISLVVNSEAEVVAPRSHRMNDRLPWRLFGLIYAHPHPRSADTTIIRNASGRPLPTDYSGQLAEDFLIDADEQQRRAQNLQGICLNCHSSAWVESFWKRFENTIRQSNRATRSATRMISDVWAAGCADATDPFNEMPEKWWQDVWLFYANGTRFASAMGGGGDYGVFADGRYQMNRRLTELADFLQRCRSPVEASKSVAGE